MKILVLNSGSSSQKSCLYEIGDVLPEDPPACLWQGTIEWDGEAGQVEIKNGRGFSRKEKIKVSSRAEATARLLDTLWKGEASAVSSLSEIDVVGHRIVHGGPAFEDPVVITAEVKSTIAAVSAIAPLHNRAELEGIEIIEKLLGAVARLRSSTPVFTRKCRSLRQCIRDRMNGWRPESVAMDFMASITSIAPGAQRNFCGEIQTHSSW